VTSGDGDNAAGQGGHEGGDFTDESKARASGLADQAKHRYEELREKAGPYLDQAKDRAGELAEKAGPAASHAAEKAGEYAEKAGGVAAHGVESASQALDKATGGKYSDTIKSVSGKLSHLLDRSHHNGPGSDTPGSTPGEGDAAGSTGPDAPSQG
jgi:ElaB/YqjD/DUF883 family membrane-anchored ribosome-binding protein